MICFVQEGQHEEEDCTRSIGIRTSSGIRMVPIVRGLDCSGTQAPPMRFALGTHAEATHLELRATLADHLHCAHHERQQQANVLSNV